MKIKVGIIITIVTIAIVAVRIFLDKHLDYLD